MRQTDGEPEYKCSICTRTKNSGELNVFPVGYNGGTNGKTICSNCVLITVVMF